MVITSSGAADRPTIDPRFQDRPREPGLDILRALAIIVVVIYHAGLFGFALPGRVHRFGWIGVDLFFALSGYLIGGQLIASLHRTGKVPLRQFFARRALRIMPAYFMVIAIYFALPALREYPTIPPIWKFLLSVQNINLVGGTSFSHAWSLAIEDQFYLTLPFTLTLLARSRRAAFFLPCFIVLGGIVLRLFLARLNLNDQGEVAFRGFQKWIYYPTWTRLDPLVFGVVLAAVRRYRPTWWEWLMTNAVWFWAPAIGLIVYALYLGESLTVAACVWQFPLIGLAMAALLVCGLSPRLPFNRITIPGTAFIASIAYSVYLSHKLVIHQAVGLCSVLGWSQESPAALLLVELLIYTGGTILFFAVERPFLQLRHRIVPRSQPARG